jgi:drug/metabolite transporter (DMT)-like permease
VSRLAVPGRVQGLLWLAVAAVGWGLNWPATKFALSEWPPFALRVVSSAGAVTLLLAIALARGERIWPRGLAQWGRLTVAGLLNVAPFICLGSLAMLWLDASEASIVAYTMPIWAGLLAWPVLGERPTAPRVAGLAVGLGGVGVLLGPLLAGAESTAALVAKLPGFALILTNAVLFALGTVLTKRRPPGMAPLASLAWQIALGSVPVLFGTLLFDRWQGVHIGPGGWLVLLHITFVALCLSYLAWFRALRLLPASSAAIGTLMVPVIGVVSAGMLLGEPLGWRQIGALGMTMTGVVLASRG